jgi:hypothetical protein
MSLPAHSDAPRAVLQVGLSQPYDWAMTTYRIGDNFDPRDFPEGPDCTATGPGGLPFCVLSKDHSGQHVAADAELRVVGVWG